MDWSPNDCCHFIKLWPMLCCLSIADMHSFLCHAQAILNLSWAAYLVFYKPRERNLLVHIIIVTLFNAMRAVTGGENSDRAILLCVQWQNLISDATTKASKSTLGVVCITVLGMMWERNFLQGNGPSWRILEEYQPHFQVLCTIIQQNMAPHLTSSVFTASGFKGFLFVKIVR